MRAASKATSWHRRTQGCTQAPHSCNRHLPESKCDSGEVFNVWRGWDFYGHGAPYNSFAGRDATRFLAKQIISQEEDDGQPLTREAGLPKSLLTIVNPRKLEHRFRMIHAGIPYALLYGQEDNDVPTFRLLPYVLSIIDGILRADHKISLPFTACWYPVART